MTEQLTPREKENEILAAEKEILLEPGEIEKKLEAGKVEASLQTEQAKEAGENAQEMAKSSSETEFVEPLGDNEKNSEATNSAPYIDHQLQGIVQAREIKNLQRQESPYQRTLSKLVHQPVISKVSEVSSKTISRPSGLLGGGIVALAGSLGYYLLAKHIGFTYNYAIFFMLFIVGFAVGLLLELFIYSFTKKRRHSN
jgi:hypothetical protein